MEYKKNHMSRIIIIEDEITIRKELTVLLQNVGYDVFPQEDFSKTIENIKKTQPDLILLDISLPHSDGYSLCKEIRDFSSVPIIFITGRNTPMDELHAFLMGGDDFITKPYNLPILLARIQSLLKRSTQNKNEGEHMEYKGIILNTVSGSIKHGNAYIELSKTELKILFCLFKNAGKIVSRIDLIEFLWDNEIHIDDNTLSVNMTRIREKLCQIDILDLIHTKRGMGYKI